MSNYSFWERDLATLYKVDFNNRKKYDKLSGKEIKLLKTIDNNDGLRNYFAQVYKVDKQERADQTGIYIQAMDGKGRVGTDRFLQELAFKEGLERGLNVVVGGGVIGALGMEVARKIHPDDPGKQLALAEIFAAGGEVLFASMETVNARHENLHAAVENTAHARDFKPLGTIEPAPPAVEKEPLEVEQKAEVEKPEAPQDTNVKNQEATRNTANAETTNNPQNPLYQQTDIMKNPPVVTEPFYNPLPPIPLRTDLNTLQQAGGANINDTMAPGVTIPPTGDGILIRPVNPAINPGGKQPSAPQEPVEGKINPGDAPPKPGNTREVNPAINPGKKPIVPTGKEGGEVKNKAGDAAAHQDNVREVNPALNQVKNKALEVKVKENTDVNPGG